MSRAPGNLAIGKRAMASGGAGAVLTLFTLTAWFIWPREAVRSYLFAYVFWLNVSLGALGWLMLSHVTGGSWGATTRRLNEAAAGVLPAMTLLGLPLVLGAGYLYGWADPGVWQKNPILLHRRPWFSMPWVAGRAVVAFAAWTYLWLMLRRLSVAQHGASAEEQLRLAQRMRSLSAVGLVVLFASVSLLSVDWIMSLEAHWISSIFGLIVMMGQATSAMAVLILVLYWLERRGQIEKLPADRVHDLGKLLLTSVVLWAYMAFSQYLIQWIGHTQEDIRWYLQRLHGGWSWVAAALCVFGLGVPLTLLLSRPLKRSLASLAIVAAWVFATRILDVLWTIAPSGHHGEVGGVWWTDLTAILGLGGIWIAVFGWLLSRSPLEVPTYLTSGANITGMVRKDVARAG